MIRETFYLLLRSLTFIAVTMAISSTFAHAATNMDIQHQEQETINLATRLYGAATNGDVDTAKKLVAAGVDINSTALVMAPLYQAASHGHVEFVRWAVQTGAKIDYKNGPSQRTALHEAVYKGQQDATKVLLELGAAPNAKNAHGRTPLFYAYFHEGKMREQFIAMLITHGATPIEPPSEKLKEQISTLTKGTEMLLKSTLKANLAPAQSDLDPTQYTGNAALAIADSDGVNPEEYAGDAALAARTNLPFETVERKRSIVERETNRLNAQQIAVLLSDTPKSQEWWKTHAKYVSDDFSLKSRIKRTLEDIPHSWELGSVGRELKLMGTGDTISMEVVSIPYRLGVWGVNKTIAIIITYFAIGIAVAGVVYVAYRGSHYFYGILRTQYRKRLFRVVVSLYCFWAISLLLTNNYEFYAIMDFNYYDNGRMLLLLTMPPAIFALAYGAYCWCRKAM